MTRRGSITRPRAAGYTAHLRRVLIMPTAPSCCAQGHNHAVRATKVHATRSLHRGHPHCGRAHHAMMLDRLRLPQHGRALRGIASLRAPWQGKDLHIKRK